MNFEKECFIKLNEVIDGSKEKSSYSIIEEVYTEIKEKCDKDEYDVDIVDDNGNTILHYACILSSYNLANVAIKEGVNYETMNNEGKTALSLLFDDTDFESKFNIAKSIMDYTSVPEELLKRDKTRHERLIEVLISKGFVETSDSEHRDILINQRDGMYKRELARAFKIGGMETSVFSTFIVPTVMGVSIKNVIEYNRLITEVYSELFIFLGMSKDSIIEEHFCSNCKKK